MVRRFIESPRRWWGKMVFRYAGRNWCAKSVSHSRKFYNVIGRFYDWIYTDQIQGYRQTADYLVEHYIAPGDFVMDLGCGTGLLLDLAKERAGRLIGVDISLGMIRQARSKLGSGPNLDFIVADCRALPLAVRFDKIVSSFMLVILEKPDRRRVIQNLYPMLKPGGMAVFFTAQDDLSPEWLTREEWQDYGRDAGFQCIDIEDRAEYFRIVRLGKI
ncbi:MAG: class I SAM-dependent methyltransferase [bacterium]